MIIRDRLILYDPGIILGEWGECHHNFLSTKYVFTKSDVRMHAYHWCCLDAMILSIFGKWTRP